MQNIGPEFTLAFLPLLAVVLFAAGISVIAILAWCMIFKRAGYSWALGLLMLIPIANVVAFLVLAFSRWPIQRELEGLRRVRVNAAPLRVNAVS